VSTQQPAKTSQKAGTGLFGWFGRQVGYVRNALKHDPTVVARREKVEDRRDPDHPGLVFRRTVTDEVRRDTDRPSTASDAKMEPTR
jgi:hypothetical protein